MTRIVDSVAFMRCVRGGAALIVGLVFFAVFAPLPPHAALTHASIR